MILYNRWIQIAAVAKKKYWFRDNRFIQIAAVPKKKRNINTLRVCTPLYPADPDENGWLPATRCLDDFNLVEKCKNQHAMSRN